MKSDGQLYLEILRDGYDYDRNNASLVAFFPLYPLAGRVVAWLTGVLPGRALLLVSNVCLAGTFVVLAFYARARFGNGEQRIARFALLTFALFPSTFFFRMAYSESCFLFLAVLSMLAMARRWPGFLIAILVGCATATRPVGIALVPVLGLHMWHRIGNWYRWTLACLLLFPLAICGIGTYVVYQGMEFGDLLAFAKTQQHYSLRSEVRLGAKTLAFLSHEPIWSVYDSDSEAYWKAVQPAPSAPLNLAFANPIFFVGATILLIVGARRGWIDSCETLLAAQLLLIPYLTRGYEMCMAGQARYAAAAFPIYMVLGRTLSGMPSPYAAGLLALSAFYLGAYTLSFVLGYPVM